MVTSMPAPCLQKRRTRISCNLNLPLLSLSVFQPGTPSVEGVTEVGSSVGSVSWFGCVSMIEFARRVHIISMLM